MCFHAVFHLIWTIIPAEGCQILFPVFGGEMATAKIQTVKGSRVEIFSHEKILLALDGLDSRNGDIAGIVFGGEMCYT